MIFVQMIKRFLAPSLFLCATSFLGIAQNEDKYGIESVDLEIQSLIPENVVEGLLQNYSEREKTLIGNDVKNIKQIAFCDKVISPEHERVYIATAGAPGACKSTILETFLQDKPNFVYADPDARALKFMTNTYHQSLTYYHISACSSYRQLLVDAYAKWRDASNYISNSILNEAYAAGFNIAHGTTLTSPVASALLSKLKQKNYKIILLLCYAPDEMRLQAVEHRASTQAFVQSSDVSFINKGKVFCQRFPTYFEYADQIHLYWTDNFLQGNIHAATYSKDTGLTVHHGDAMTSFTKKYDADRKDSPLPSLDELVKQKISQDNGNVAYPTTWINY